MPITASVNYHVKSDAPQAFEFDADGVIGQLISPELITTTIKVDDLRNTKTQPNFQTDGITFIKHASEITQFKDEVSWQARYEQELRALLRETIGAVDVLVFDHTIRTDDPSAERRPARNVHNDYNAHGAEQRLVDIVGEKRAQNFRVGHFAFVNIWRPVGRPIQSSPLGFIDPHSMDIDDWMDIDLIYPDRRGQILGVANNPAHQWFFKSQMTPDEVAIFNIYDNGGRPHLAHSALDLPGDDQVRVPRKSIESRTLVRYS